MVQPLDYRGKSINSFATSVIGSVLVRPANPKRKGAAVINNGVTIKYLCKQDIAVVNAGVALYPNGGAYEINLTNPYYGPLAVYCAVAGENITWTEDE